MCFGFYYIVMKWNSKIYVLANNNIDIEQPLNSSTSLPSGFEYRPIRVEDRDDLEEFIENSVLGSCRNRNIIVDYIRH